MKLGFIILAHQNLYRTAQLVRFLAENDCCVSLHIDKTAAVDEVNQLHSDLKGLSNVVYSDREKCCWGQFSIVKATLNAAESLFEHYPEVTNVFLTSGSCLPARPIKQLQRFLKRNNGVDFIESYSVKDKQWVKGGLNEERLTLYFPVSWRRHRFIFDRFVNFQRKLKIRRRIPSHISPHMGSQWWCLTADTLKKIVTDPNRKTNDQFFSRTWISDESYFQTLVRNHSKKIKNNSLTFAMFDSQGKPFLFYDDHLEKLPLSSAFFIRKVWEGADGLYKGLLKTKRKSFAISESNDEEFYSIFSTANERRNKGVEGSFLQGRFPHASSARSGVSRDDFIVLTGFDHLFQNFTAWAREENNMNVFGNIFSLRKFTFKKRISLAPGNLIASAKIRDANPKCYLSNFLNSYSSNRRIGFLFDVSDSQKIMPTITQDKKAHFIFVKEAWLLSVAASDLKFKGKLLRAKILQAREKKFLKMLDKTQQANCKIFSLNEALSTPGMLLQEMSKALDADTTNKPIPIPHLNELSKLDTLVRKLKKNDMVFEYKIVKRKKSKTYDNEKKKLRKPYVIK